MLGQCDHRRQSVEDVETFCPHAIKCVTGTDRLQNSQIGGDTFTYEPITEVTRHRRLRWTGRVCRIPRDNIPRDNIPRDNIVGRDNSVKLSKDSGRKEGHRRGGVTRDNIGLPQLAVEGYAANRAGWKDATSSQIVI